jgi:hypothetical protein
MPRKLNRSLDDLDITQSVKFTNTKIVVWCFQDREEKTKDSQKIGEIG